MPYEIKHISPNKFQVTKRITGKVHSRGTTVEKAQSQVRLMEWTDSKRRFQTGK